MIPFAFQSYYLYGFTLYAAGLVGIILLGVGVWALLRRR